MLFDANAKDNTRFISLHIELNMWGDDFLDFDASNPTKPEIRWVSLCDGGDVEDQGSKCITKEDYHRIMDYIYFVDFPNQEDDEMNIKWEILCFDANEDCIAGIDFGYWNKDVLIKMVRHLQDILNDETPFRSIVRTIEA